MMQVAGILNGVRVLDLSRVLAGPFCCQVLADLGADVVKVERPGSGDDTRQWGPPFLNGDGPSAYYLSCNRGKRSVALDLAHPDARGVLDDLLRAADVVVENFRLGSLARLGLDPQRLATLNPRLVRISISGFGRNGPEADVPGYDLTIQALGGLMSITGESDGPPLKVGVAITDVLTGLYGAVSALAGLYARDRSASANSANDGSSTRQFDLALADCTLSALVNVVQSVLVTGQRPLRYGNAHPQIVPYEAFATADGYLVLAIGNDGQWGRFCVAAGCGPWSLDPRFASNPARVEHRDTLIPQLAKLLAARTTIRWLSLCAAAEVPCAPVLMVDEILATPQVSARGMIAQLTNTAGRVVPVVASPIHADGRALCAEQSPPELGEHTAEVLQQWLGYDAVRIEQLRQQVVVA
jgi:crotonobetainyl-CoA:carnitine CoA-transferase CaiB-like acyl-CoA transferase